LAKACVPVSVKRKTQQVSPWCSD